MCSAALVSSLRSLTQALFLVVVLFLLPSESLAESVRVLGTPGVAGDPGEAGTLPPPTVTFPTAGGDGGDGGDATALADAADLENEATAFGGDGGRGGLGGESILSGLPGAPGGTGGNGGDANATALVTDGVNASSHAEGGIAGGGGNGGPAPFPTPRGEQGEGGAFGGSATARSTLSTDGALAPSSSFSVTSTAVGGGWGQEQGGNALAISEGRLTSGDLGGLSIHSQAIGGRAVEGGIGGDATAESFGESDGGGLTVRATATGGRLESGRSVESFGGDATARAHGEYSGSTGSLFVEATASGDGIAREASTPGTAVVSVEAIGIASGGADVTVRARANGTNGEAIRDAVSGSTAGDLRLEQTVSGSDGNSTREAGDVLTSLDAMNAGGGNLTARVLALGGDGEESTDLAGRAVIESVHATGAQDVSVRAEARSGEGRFEIGQGNPATIGSVVGRSTGGGTVVVEAIADSTRANGERSVALDNVVDGETSGRLEMTQSAIAAGGIGVSSRSETSHASEHVDVLIEARGGVADARGIVTNSAGGIDLTVSATSGLLNRNATAPRDTQSVAEATTQGDGHAIRIGSAVDRSASGGRGLFGGVNALSSRGGDALSRSVGTAEGDSEVTVYDFAQAGAGGGASVFTPGVGNGGRGGDARSSVSVSNAGSSDVEGSGHAIGGAGGLGRGDGSSSGDGGDAFVSGTGTSLGGGDVVLELTAQGGDGGDGDSSTGVAAGRGGDVGVESLSGSTAGELTFDIDLIGGRGGEIGTGQRARGGDVEVDLDVANTGGGALDLSVNARTYDEGEVILTGLRGSSTSGADVSVTAGISLNDVSGGEYAVSNFVDGETSGSLELVQGVFAGGADRVVSELSRASTGEVLMLESRASARDASEAYARGAAEVVDGSGEATATASGTRVERVLAEADSRATGAGDATARSNTLLTTNDASQLSTAQSRAYAISGRAWAESDAEVYDAGSAALSAHAENAGVGDVTARSELITRGAGGGTYELEARGVSSGGADVFVSTTLRRRDVGGDAHSELHNTVSGSTAGNLSLSQQIFSDRGPIETSLVAENEGGGALELYVGGLVYRPEPGSFPSPPPGPRNIEIGPAIGSSDSGAAVSVGVGATGESVSRRVNEDGTMAPIRGTSNGGDAEVGASVAVWGVLDAEISDEVAIGGAGRSVEMDGWVEAETTGRIQLEQTASAAHGAGVGGFFTTTPAVGGAGGDATSRIEQTGSSESIHVESTTNAGAGGTARSQSAATGGRGGIADSSAVTVNRSGEAVALSSAFGGRGGSATTTGVGGAARSTAYAKSIGDDHRVQVGRGPEESPGRIRPTGAVGGDAGSIFRARDPSIVAGAGGDASSTSMGRAAGDSEVDVYDRATGGTGGQGTSSRFREVGIGGRGGSAESAAVAQGSGLSRVSARSDAIGGNGGVMADGVGRGGDASASARARGFGAVFASSSAIGGVVQGAGGIGGDATALSIANGGFGSAEAVAVHSAEFGERLGATVERDVVGISRVSAHATRAALATGRPKTVDGYASIWSSPSDADIAQATGLHAELAAFVQSDERADIVAMGEWGARAGDEGAVNQRVELDITLQQNQRLDPISIAIFETSVLGDGFGSLAFSVEVGGEQVGETNLFDDLASARAFFASMFSIGDAFADSPDRFGAFSDGLKLIFDVVVEGREGIHLGFAAVVIPEPSTGLLIGFGLLWLSRRARRTSAD